MKDNYKKNNYIDIGERISKQALITMEMLEDSGYEAYLVGGSLRDILMGREVHDFDVTSSAKPQEVMGVFADFKVIPTGQLLF